MRKSAALDYEHLFRRVYQSSPSFSAGTSADYYRKVDHSYKYLNDALARGGMSLTPGGKSLDDLRNKHQSILLDIASRVRDAIVKAIQRFDSILSEEQKNELTAFEVQLEEPTLEQLEATIWRVGQLLGQVGVYPR